MPKFNNEYAIINKYRENVPVNVKELCLTLGIDVREAYLGDKLAGMIEKLKNEYVIIINAEHNEEKQRFTLAHILGHYILHRKLIQDGVDDDHLYRSSTLGRFHNMNFGPEEEVQAHQFAYNVLVPFDSVKEQLNRILEEADQEPPELGEIYELLAKKFHVTKNVMKARLDDSAQKEGRAPID